MAGARGEAGAQLRVGLEAFEHVGELTRIVARRNDARRRVEDLVAGRARRSDARETAGHGFEKAVRQAFAIGGEDEDVGRVEIRAHVGDGARELDPILEPGALHLRA